MNPNPGVVVVLWTNIGKEKVWLEPALKLPEPIHLVCREAKPDGLLDDLSLHELDVVLTDSPVSPSQHVRAFNHLLVECNVVFLGTKELGNLYQRGFPKSLHQAPVLLPFRWNESWSTREWSPLPGKEDRPKCERGKRRLGYGCSSTLRAARPDQR